MVENHCIAVDLFLALEEEAASQVLKVDDRCQPASRSASTLI